MSEEHDPRMQGPGCGLAAYGSLLMAFAAVGLIGSFASLAAILFVPGAQGPSPLQTGAEVHVWQLQPMRDAGLLELTEAPLAWHDESNGRDGTVACGFKVDSVIRIEDGTAYELAFADISTVSHTGDEATGMVITLEGGDTRFSCTFGKEELGSRFLRQIEIESELSSTKTD